MALLPNKLTGPVTETTSSEAVPEMIAPHTAQAAVTAMSQLVLGIIQSRVAQVRNGPTTEDLLREKLRPVIREWLDSHLPPIVERLVRVELERLSAGIPFED